MHSPFSEVWQTLRLLSSSDSSVLNRGTSLASGHRQEGKLSNHRIHLRQWSDESTASWCTEGDCYKYPVRLNYICFDKLVVKVMSIFSTAPLKKEREKKDLEKQQVK